MRWIKFRHNQILLAVMILMTVLLVRLFDLTVVEGSEWSKEAESISIKRVYSSAPRGEILDRYGRLLAGNRPSFTVFFSEGNLKNDEINRQALELANLLERNGDTINDNLPIIRNADGSFYYTYQKVIEEWLESQAMPVNYTAEDAFNEIRARNGIDEGLDRFEAQSELQTIYSIYPPISVKNMKFLQELEKESFLGRYYLDYELTA
ncbi:MAG: penicillin-binding protein, partial [Clostridiales bacterium]|nr:penicillin-binding protein [Clostridiales bacterium]